MKASTLAVAGVLALTAAGVGHAQQGAAPVAGREGRAWQQPDPAQMAERHAERLRALLQLRPDQEPALRALVQAITPPPGEMERRRAEMAEARTLTTPQRLDRMQARLAERQTRFARMADEVRRFYAQLTPAQQRAFDAIPMHDMGGRGPGPGGMHGGGPGMRGPGGMGARP